ncbi:MAG: 2-hydroxyacid dehydrogenase [Tunicatimonas sp.]|uniref:2-hydroxyacid dehydrogenase n=1 Tax=Tunicatimonas sp. TaxID=1940096 RepID=UPI003C776599
MKIAFFSTKTYDQTFMNQVNEEFGHEISYFDTGLSPSTAVLAQDHEAVCIFVNDQGNEETLKALKDQGVKLLALRSAGFNHVDIAKAEELGIKIVRVPAYSPYAVAEHALAMILTLNRKTHLAYSRVRDGNFSLERLTGFDLRGKTVGVIGTGAIGQVFAHIMMGVGCRVVAYDPRPNEELKQHVDFVGLPELFGQSDIISLHCPLTKETHYIINEEAIKQMKNSVMLINTSRGGLVDTKAVIKGLKDQRIGYFGLDVYEQEENIFFEDLSGAIIQDDMITRLMTFPNALITSHQAFFTQEAMTSIAETTLQNIRDFEEGKDLENEVVHSDK